MSSEYRWFWYSPPGTRASEQHCSVKSSWSELKLCAGKGMSDQAEQPRSMGVDRRRVYPLCLPCQIITLLSSLGHSRSLTHYLTFTLIRKDIYMWEAVPQPRAGPSPLHSALSTPCACTSLPTRSGRVWSGSHIWLVSWLAYWMGWCPQKCFSQALHTILMQSAGHQGFRAASAL